MTCTMSHYIARKFNILGTDNREFLVSTYLPTAV